MERVACGGVATLIPRRATAVAMMALLAALSGCSRPHHPGWVIHSSIEVHGPLAAGGYRLVFPYIVGDLYGSPNTGSFVVPVSQSGSGFTLDLNRSQQALESELGPVDFSLRFLKIAPADARFARLTPVALQRSGIEPVGPVEWRDAQSGRALMLVYIDRPAQIEGSLTRGGQTIRYDIRAAVPGYVWIGTVQAGAHETRYTVVPPPQRLILTITARSQTLSRRHERPAPSGRQPGGDAAPVERQVGISATGGHTGAVILCQPSPPSLRRIRRAPRSRGL